jgi:hypothetical protein
VRPAPDGVDRDLRVAFAGLLLEQGFNEIVDPSDRDAAKSTGRIRVWLRRVVRQFGIPAWLTVSLAFVFLEEFGAPPISYVGTAVICLGVVSVIVPPPSHFAESARVPPSGVSAILFTVLWAALFAATGWGIAFELDESGLEGLAATYGMAAASVFLWLTLLAGLQLAALVFRRAGFRRVSAGLTLIVPIGVAVLFVQLFAVEVWEVADGLTLGRVVALALVTVVPLYVLLCRQLTSSVPGAFAREAQRLAEHDDDAEPDRAPHKLAARRLERDVTHRKEPRVEQQLRGAFRPTLLTGRARPLAGRLRRTFAVLLPLGLMPVIFLVWLLMSVYIYGLAAITIDRDRVEAWLTPERSPRATIEDISLFGFHTGLPGGPYLVIAVLLGILAAAIFLALTLTEEQYKEVLAQTALHGRVQDCLLLSMPYLHLVTTNDAPGTATQIADEQGRIEGDTTFATRGDDDPFDEGTAMGHSVWYRWVAPRDGRFTFRALAPGFDPLVAVRHHAQPPTVEACSVDERVGFQAVADEEYLIAVDGRSDGRGSAAGRFGLEWGPGPTNDAFDQPLVLHGDTGTQTCDSRKATAETGEPRHAGHVGRSLWFRWTAPRDERMTFDTAGSGFDTVLAIYSGASIDELDLVAANDDAPGLGQCSRVIFDAAAGSDYRVAVDGWGRSAGDVQLNWRPAPKPANDNFAGAEPISDESGSVDADTTFALHEEGEPDRGGNEASLWYAWTAPRDGGVTFRTTGATIPPLLAAYVGTAVDQLTAVAVSEHSFEPSITFAARAGRVYHVAVNARFSMQGPFRLEWEPASIPRNNLFQDAIAIAGLSGRVRGTNVNASREPDEPEHAALGGRSVWYRWTAPRTAWVVFRTRSSEFDTLLGVYTGDRVDALQAVAANDDAFLAATGSRVVFRAQAGVRYSVAVDGFVGLSGLFTLRWLSLPGLSRRGRRPD